MRLTRRTILLCLGALPLFGEAGKCIVCGGPIREPPPSPVMYRSRERALCSATCEDTWKGAAADNSLDALTRNLEPRAALFQGDSRFLNQAFQDRQPLSYFWLFVAAWVVLGTVSGGLAAALAVSRHRSRPAAFWLGFVLPGVGIAAALRLPACQDEFAVRGTKIPRTHDQVECPSCHAANHPAVNRCRSCGTSLTPIVASEVGKVKDVG